MPPSLGRFHQLAPETPASMPWYMPAKHPGRTVAAVAGELVAELGDDRRRAELGVATVGIRLIGRVGGAVGGG